MRGAMLTLLWPTPCLPSLPVSRQDPDPVLKWQVISTPPCEPPTQIDAFQADFDALVWSR